MFAEHLLALAQTRAELEVSHFDRGEQQADQTRVDCPSEQSWRQKLARKKTREPKLKLGVQYGSVSMSKFYQVEAEGQEEGEGPVVQVDSVGQDGGVRVTEPAARHRGTHALQDAKKQLIGHFWQSSNCVARDASAVTDGVTTSGVRSQNIRSVSPFA